MSSIDGDYLPAAGHHWALPLYDPLLRLLGMDALREPLVQRVAAQPGARVLDVGCGTGTLAVALKRAYPEALVVGLDPDPKALAIARDKARHAGASLDFVQGFGDHIDQPSGSCDQVVSSFMFHHLTKDAKRAVLGEVRRVLRSGGRFHLLDFVDHAAKKSRIMRALHVFGGHALRGEVQDDLVALLTEQGFQVQNTEHKPLVLFGTLGYYESVKPPTPADVAT